MPISTATLHHWERRAFQEAPGSVGIGRVSDIGSIWRGEDVNGRVSIVGADDKDSLMAEQAARGTQKVVSSQLPGLIL